METRKRKCRWIGHTLRKDGASRQSSRKQRKRKTKKQLEEIHSERSCKKLSELRYLMADRDK
jgi:hypothetical protein